MLASGQPQDGKGEVPQGGHDAGAAGGADLGAVFVVVHVADPVQPVLDHLVAASARGRGRPGEARELGEQSRLVALDREHEMSAAPKQIGSGATLGVHRIAVTMAPAMPMRSSRTGNIGISFVFAPTAPGQRGTVSMIEGSQQVIAGIPAAGSAP